MNPREALSIEDPEPTMQTIFNNIHANGPTDTHELEILSYIKLSHIETFKKHEENLINLLGLFFKTRRTNSVFGLVYKIFSSEIKKTYGHIYTPIQAAIKNGISDNLIYSFSAPTSAGKSFLLRSILETTSGDAIIVVPSRALIAEYLLVLRNRFHENKKILILQSIDDINKNATDRRIFVVTPERACELLKPSVRFNIDFIFYDEAQISEDDRRGIIFDYVVRELQTIYPNATKVFAHPFVQNPEAQLLKHNTNAIGKASAYSQQSVGKIYLEYKQKTQTFYFFSPHVENCHLLANKMETEDIPFHILENGGTILVYTSKSAIYNGSYISTFEKYINLLKPVVNPIAIQIIGQIEELIGAKTRDSKLISLMKYGIVVHHGSMPLNVRYLIERFTKAGYARICFATSTLAQGVNMPFDVVWLDNMRLEGDEDDKRLALRNLIGRSGRTTEKSIFDIGFVVTSNPKKFSERFRSDLTLSNISKLDETTDIPEDYSEFVAAIRTGDIDQKYHMPISRVERLKTPEVNDAIILLLELLYAGDNILNCNSYNILPKSIKRDIKDAFHFIYAESLGRELKTGEKDILSTAITILLMQIQGKSFKEILALRYYYLTRQQEKRILKGKLESNEISAQQYGREFASLTTKWSAIPDVLPNVKLATHAQPRYKQTHNSSDIDYDLLVYDTYDYIDKVISFSLSDVYWTAFSEYYETTNDQKALNMANYFRYGTSDRIEILLLRYGFSFEDIEIIKNHIKSISEDGIVFKESVNSIGNHSTLEIASRYIE